MNKTDTERTTKADDVVADKQTINPTIEQDENTGERENDQTEPEESIETQKSDAPVGKTEYSHEARSEPLVDEKDELVKENAENSVTSSKSTTKTKLLGTGGQTTPHPFKPLNKEDFSKIDTEIKSNQIHTDTAPETNPASDIDNIHNSPSNISSNSNSNHEDKNKDSTSLGNNNDADEHKHKDSRSGLDSNTNDNDEEHKNKDSKSSLNINNNNNNGDNSNDQLDLITVKYTTIFLRLFAPESTTTATPNLGNVQQELSGQKQKPNDNGSQKSPLVDKPQTFDAERKANTTSTTSLTPSISTSSLSTQYTTTPIPQVPVIVNSTSPSPLQEVPSNSE